MLREWWESIVGVKAKSLRYRGAAMSLGTWAFVIKTKSACWRENESSRMHPDGQIVRWKKGQAMSRRIKVTQTNDSLILENTLMKWQLYVLSEKKKPKINFQNSQKPNRVLFFDWQFLFKYLIIWRVTKLWHEQGFQSF